MDKELKNIRKDIKVLTEQIEKKHIELVEKIENSDDNIGLTERVTFNKNVCDPFKKYPVPSSLKKLLSIDDEIMTKLNLLKLLNKYFIENEMYDGELIHVNKKIELIFSLGKKDQLTCLNIGSYLDELIKQ